MATPQETREAQERRRRKQAEKRKKNPSKADIYIKNNAFWLVPLTLVLYAILAAVLKDGIPVTHRERCVQVRNQFQEAFTRPDRIDHNFRLEVYDYIQNPSGGNWVKYTMRSNEAAEARNRAMQDQKKLFAQYDKLGCKKYFAPSISE